MWHWAIFPIFLYLSFYLFFFSSFIVFLLLLIGMRRFIHFEHDRNACSSSCSLFSLITFRLGDLIEGEEEFAFPKLRLSLFLSLSPSLVYSSWRTLSTNGVHGFFNSFFFLIIFSFLFPLERWTLDLNYCRLNFCYLFLGIILFHLFSSFWSRVGDNSTSTT